MTSYVLLTTADSLLWFSAYSYHTMLYGVETLGKLEMAKRNVDLGTLNLSL